MSHIRVKSEESDDDSLFVPPTYRPRVQVLIEAAKLRKSQSATPAPTPTPTRITHVDGEEDEDDHLMASIEQEDVQSAYEDANTHVDGDVEMSACDADEERERDSVTPGPFNGEVDPGVSCVRIARPNTTSAERASAAAAEVHTPAGMARLGVPVSGPFSAPASFSPAFSRSSVLSDRQLADVAAIRERIQKAKEMKAAKDKEKEVDLMVIENAQVSLPFIEFDLHRLRRLY